MIWPAILNFLSTQWKGVATGLALGLVMGLAACGLRNTQGAPAQAISTAGAAESVSGTATAHSGGTIEVPGRPAFPCPADKICPEVNPVKIIYDCSSVTAGNVQANVSATASIIQQKPGISVWAGGGILTDFSAVTGGYGEVRAQLASWGIPLRLDSNLKASIGLDYKFIGP